MKKIYKLFSVIYFSIVGIIIFKCNDLLVASSKIYNDLEYIKCGSAEHIPRAVPQLVSVAYTLLMVGTPIVLIVFSIIKLVKSIAAGNADEIEKAKKNLFSKFIISAIIFFVSFIVQFILNQVTSNDIDKKTMSSCIKCFLYYSETNCLPSDSGFDTDDSRYKPGYTSNFINSNVKPKSNSSTTNPTNSDGLFEDYKNDNSYKILKLNKGWDEFYNQMRSNNVYEASNPAKYSDKCLSFAYYHAHAYYTGDYSGYANSAANYSRASHFKSFDDDNKKVILTRVYNELMKGKPVILQVSGTSLTSRHYVTVVGMKKTTNPSDPQETDFIMLDPYQGTLRDIGGTGRVMITGAACGKTYSGYQIYYLID